LFFMFFMVLGKYWKFCLPSISNVYVLVNNLTLIAFVPVIWYL